MWKWYLANYYEIYQDVIRSTKHLIQQRLGVLQVFTCLLWVFQLHSMGTYTQIQKHSQMIHSQWVLSPPLPSDPL